MQGIESRHNFLRGIASSITRLRTPTGIEIGGNIMWAGTGDYSNAYNRRVGQVKEPEIDTRTPTQRAADFHLAAHERWEARKKAEEQRVIDRQRQRQLAEKAQADRRAAMKLTEFTENMIDAEIAEFSPEERGQIWMTMVEQNRVDIEYAAYLALALRTSKAHAVVKQNEEKLARLKQRHKFVWMLVTRKLREHNWPETLESCERVVAEMGLDRED
jgi:hypothetical protein